MDHEAILDQLVMPIAVPKSIGTGAGVLPSTNDGTLSDEPSDSVNTLQGVQDTLLLDTEPSRTEVTANVTEACTRPFHLVCLNQRVKLRIFHQGVPRAYSKLVHFPLDGVPMDPKGSGKLRFGYAS